MAKFVLFFTTIIMWQAIVTILCGLIVVAPSLFQKNKKVSKRLTEYQGRFGIVVLVWGIFQLIGALGAMSYLSLGLWGIIFWIIYLLIAVVLIALGFILGFELIIHYVPSQKKNADKVLKKLMPRQKTIGIAAIVLGVLEIVTLIIL